ncbi:Protein pacG [Madurella mycetomatis]|uniref:Protein pacG n=1 Tax=Madurella mycetomatis TaxID=100816 RepID=A0A175W3M0_9PEZI|nr:Protein pacG [Madurella mycetomatis]
MAGFNSMPALSSGATPGPDTLGLTASGMDAFDANMAFDDSLLDPVHGLPNLPFTPSTYDFEAFGTTFEDPFSYPARPFENAGVSALNNEAYNGEALSPQELDNKLLGFGAPIPGKATLIGEAGQFIEPNMTGELYGMFFVAEDVFGSESNPGRPLELTCYRRNLWQISGQITLPRHVANYVDDQGRQAPVVELAASISAIESIEGKATEMITIPWKSSNAALGAEEPKMPSPPPVVPLDLSSGHEVDGNHVSVPVSWKRLQFKHATANNGRRKGLQQHYVVQINLLVKTKNGEHIKVAEIQSGPVIVRGRSPRNFDSRKDVPLSADRRVMERRATEGSSSSTGAGSSKPQQQHQDRGDLVQNLQRYHSLGNVQQSSPEWTTPFSTPLQQPQQHANKKIALSSPSLNRPPIPPWGSVESPSTPSISGNKFINPTTANNLPTTPAPPTTSSTATTTTITNKPKRTAAPPTLPINLSLSEDERSPNRSNSADSAQSPQFTKQSTSLSGQLQAQSQGHGSSTSQNPLLTSPLESADMLYEYFPLSLDDWMPPVDAIYRPHVVHHTIVPPEVKAQQMRSKTKRYFAAE